MAVMLKRTPSSQRGTSLIELMMAMFVLAVGVLASAFLIPYSLGGNSRSKQQSHSTVIAQMVMEKITSASAGGAAALTITDCPGTAHNINITGTAGGTGSALLASGDVDFSQALGSAGAPVGYYMQYTTCGTAGRQAMYDIRWNIQTPSNYVNLVTVSAKLSGTGADLKYFSLPVTIRSLVGGN
jgi:prepilin-type N-terminal cleavage/methylation domain-containing protein